MNCETIIEGCGDESDLIFVAFQYAIYLFII